MTLMPLSLNKILDNKYSFKFTKILKQGLYRHLTKYIRLIILTKTVFVQKEDIAKDVGSSPI